MPEIRGLTEQVSPCARVSDDQSGDFAVFLPKVSLLGMKEGPTPVLPSVTSELLLIFLPLAGLPVQHVIIPPLSEVQPTLVCSPSLST